MQAGLSLEVPDRGGQTAGDEMDWAILAEPERRRLHRSMPEITKAPELPPPL
jgi:hypothetical protein